MPSGRQPRFHNRVAWAKVYLEQAALIVSPRRAYFQITDRGRTVAAKPPARIDIGFLEQFEESARSVRPGVGPRTMSVPPAATLLDAETPEEVLERAYQRIRAELASDLLGRVKQASPQFFERLVAAGDGAGVEAILRQLQLHDVAQQGT